MTEKLQKTIQEELEKLPQEMQEAIGASNWVKISEGIGQKYFIDDAEINAFQGETAVTLMGLRDPNAYARKIADNIGTSYEQADEIAKEVMTKIFLPVADKIEELIKENFKDKKWTPEQTLEFILSNGNYFTLIKPKTEKTLMDITVSNKIKSIRKEDLRSGFTI